MEQFDRQFHWKISTIWWRFDRQGRPGLCLGWYCNCRALFNNPVAATWRMGCQHVLLRFTHSIALCWKLYGWQHWKKCFDVAKSVLYLIYSMKASVNGSVLYCFLRATAIQLCELLVDDHCSRSWHAGLQKHHNHPSEAGYDCLAQVQPAFSPGKFTTGCALSGSAIIVV